MEDNEDYCSLNDTSHLGSVKHALFTALGKQGDGGLWLQGDSPIFCLSLLLVQLKLLITQEMTSAGLL